MHKELIGQEASLSLPSTVDAADVLFGFVEELMDVSDDEARDPDRVKAELSRAIDALRSDEAVDGTCNVVARIEIHDAGVEVHLTCENRDAVRIEIAEQVVAAPQA